MDGSRIISFVFLSFSYILLSNMVVADATEKSFVCPTIVINIQSGNYTISKTTTASACQNGRNMTGCCIDRISCDYNTSHIDLSMYGPRGFVKPCGPDLSCCPREYILPIPINNTSSDSSNSGSDSGDASNDNIVDSDSASDEADEKSDKIPSFTGKKVYL